MLKCQYGFKENSDIKDAIPEFMDYIMHMKKYTIQNICLLYLSTYLKPLILLNIV